MDLLEDSVHWGVIRMKMVVKIMKMTGDCLESMHSKKVSVSEAGSRVSQHLKIRSDNDGSEKQPPKKKTGGVTDKTFWPTLY